MPTDRRSSQDRCARCGAPRSRRRRTPAPGAAPAERSAPPQQVTSESISQRMARLAEAVGREPKLGRRAPSRSRTCARGWRPSAAAPGIAPDSLPAEAQARLLHLAGRLVREAFVGLKDLERTRSETRNRYRIETAPPEPDDPRPSLAQPDGRGPADRAVPAARGAPPRLGAVAARNRQRSEGCTSRRPHRPRVPPSSSSSTAWIRPSSRRASSAPRAAARPAPRTRRSTGNCSRPSTATSSRCRQTTCHTPSWRPSPRRTARLCGGRRPRLNEAADRPESLALWGGCGTAGAARSRRGHGSGGHPPACNCPPPPGRHCVR